MLTGVQYTKHPHHSYPHLSAVTLCTNVMKSDTSCGFSARFAPIISLYMELDAVCHNDWHKTTGKMCIKFAHWYLHNG